jgi:hypothetical protein
MSSTHGRRSFFSALASFGGLALVGSAREAAAGQSTAPNVAPYDMAWLNQMKGKHKQVYDLGQFDLSEDQRPLRFARNFMDSFKEVEKVQDADLNTCVGISGGAMPMNVNDAMWAKYKLGERAKIIDPTTKQPSVRNIFVDMPEIGVKAMQARGTIFWQCNMALTAQATQIANAMKLPPAEVKADLIANFNPGVKLMPSHMMALAMVQERGFSYVRP